MLRLIKKHIASCSKTSEKDWKCKAKVGNTKPRCPFYIVGPNPKDPTGPRIKKHTETSNEQTAKAALFEFERSLFDPTPKPQIEEPAKTIQEAIEHFLTTRKHRSKDRQNRLRRQLTAMRHWLEETHNRKTVKDTKKTDLEEYMFSWQGEYTTLKTRRENVKSFWKYCYDSDFTAKNIAAALPAIGDDRQLKDNRVPTLTDGEVAAILGASERCGDLFRREGENVSKQVRAFTLVQCYTGLAIGDTAKLRKDEVVGNEILVNRKKTGEPVFTSVPPFVIEALREMRSDSSEYYFWSGKGKLHTRTSKWGGRLQKLYVFARVRVSQKMKRRRSGGKLKDGEELVEVSSVTPHYWRHTFVRDHYLRGTDVETIADLIGDDPDTVRDYYSCFDKLRQKKLIETQQRFWEGDEYYRRLSAGATILQ